MKKIINTLFLIASLSCANNTLQAQNKPASDFSETEKDQLAQQYIAQYKHFAIQEMQKTGIPASITLAQGLHESDYGRSRLAKLANNHFGAKAHNTWTGDVLLHDDDAPSEKFRKYTSAEQSYRDHSKVLAKDRYRFLYRLNPYDYKAWAHGLKKAGYATDPNYAYKLIQIIENYALHLLDNPNYAPTKQEAPVLVSNNNNFISASYTKNNTSVTTTSITASPLPTTAALTPNDAGYLSASYTKPEPSVTTTKKTTKPKKKNRDKQEYTLIQTKEVAQVVYTTEPTQSLDWAMRQEFTDPKPEPQWHNGSKALFFDRNIMPSEVAFWYQIDLDKLLKWNYAHAHIPFEKQKPVYLEPMRTKGGAMSDKSYTALRGQNLVDVALASGIKLERLMKLNKVNNPLDYILPGEEVQLKRKARKGIETIAKHHLEVLAQIPTRSAYINTTAFGYLHNFDKRTVPTVGNDFFKEILDEPTPISTQSVTYLSNHTSSNYVYQTTEIENTLNFTTQVISPSPIIDSQQSVENTLVIPAAEARHFSSNVISPLYHTVLKGETLYRLSVMYQVSVDSIKQLNNIDNNIIKVGKQVRVR